MITRHTYFAFDEEYSRKKKTQTVKYYWLMDLSDVIFSVEAETKGHLGSVYSVTSEKYLSWSDSYKKDLWKKQDYEKIQEKLFIMGTRLKNYFKKNNIEYRALNCSEELKQMGFRELKDFEEKILLDALRGK
jgi:hypothetical protein